MTDWILCSDRLPKVSGIYLVTLEFSDGSLCAVADFDCNKNDWVAVIGPVDVIAWMLLPEPYKGKAHG